MSDIFNHRNDAFDRYEAEQDDVDGPSPVELMRGPARRRAMNALAVEPEPTDFNAGDSPHYSPRQIRSGRPRKPGRKRQPSPEGEGPCPKCGAPTRLVDKGAYGPFHGCSKFPDCRGTRRATAEEIQTSEENRTFWAEHGMTDPSDEERAERGDAPRTQTAYGKYPYGVKHHSDSLKGAL